MAGTRRGTGGSEVFRVLMALGLGIATALFIVAEGINAVFVVVGYLVFALILTLSFRSKWANWADAPVRTWIPYGIITALLLVASATLRFTDLTVVASTIIGPIMALALYIQLGVVAEALRGTPDSTAPNVNGPLN